MRKLKIEGRAYIHPTATVLGEVELGRDASLWPGAVVRGDLEPVRIGRKSNVQDNAVIHTSKGYPVEIGDRVSVGHGAVVHGATIERDCLIGMNATVMNGAVIRRGSIIGAGAVVTEGTEVGPYEVWIGVPAKRIGTADEERVEEIRENARRYLELAREELPEWRK
ncbi:gamma carbonic anhydrase family protein [Methanopyrus sp. KOL6]|uniref:gamma carbonic anhydrase family protein n=1 Tax=Methanopyrus sp. KOL6 TaxID=1937004 RepID=UPI000B4BF26C|nr:gamma carbonic anhydrase family protein [Methanopyrus sp. KOL6]